MQAIASILASRNKNGEIRRNAPSANTTIAKQRLVPLQHSVRVHRNHRTRAEVPRRVYEPEGVPGRKRGPHLQVRVRQRRTGTGHRVAVQHGMVADHESNVVDGPTHDETARLHENPPVRGPDILDDNAPRLSGLETVIAHRPILNRPPVGFGDTAAGCLDTGHGAIDLGASVTNVRADTLEEPRRPSELKPHVTLEQPFGLRGQENRSPLERAAKTMPNGGDTAFDARKMALHDIGRRRIGNGRIRVVETVTAKGVADRAGLDMPFPTHTLRNPQKTGFAAPLTQHPPGNVVMVPREARHVRTTRLRHDQDLRSPRTPRWSMAARSRTGKRRKMAPAKTTVNGIPPSQPQPHEDTSPLPVRHEWESVDPEVPHPGIVLRRERPAGWEASKRTNPGTSRDNA